MSALQWKRTWVQDEGWHNSGEIGRIQNVYFSHNIVWATGQDNYGYSIDTYYNSDKPQVLNDKYRRGTMTIDYKNGHNDTGGVVDSDLSLPVIVIVKDHSEVPHIETRYMDPLIWLPLEAKTNTPDSSLNVRDKPGGTISTKLPHGTKVMIFKLAKIGNDVWGLITNPESIPGWISLAYTDAGL